MTTSSSTPLRNAVSTSTCLYSRPSFWYQTLHARLIKLGFQRSTYDVGLYYKNIGKGIVMIPVHEDDMTLIGKPDRIEEVLRGLRAQFNVKDRGRV